MSRNLKNRFKAISLISFALFVWGTLVPSNNVVSQYWSPGVFLEDGQLGTGIRQKCIVDSFGDNRCLVDAAITGNPSGGAPTTSTNKNLRFRDINSTSGTSGVDRNATIAATFTTIWKKDGKGLVYAWSINMESPAEWTIRMMVDGSDIFVGTAGLVVNDVVLSSIYRLKSSGGLSYDAVGIWIIGDSFFFNGPLGFPIEYSTSFEIQAKTNAGNKKFKAGFVHLTEVP